MAVASGGVLSVSYQKQVLCDKDDIDLKALGTGAALGVAVGAAATYAFQHQGSGMNNSHNLNAVRHSATTPTLLARGLAARGARGPVRMRWRTSGK